MLAIIRVALALAAILISTAPAGAQISRDVLVVGMEAEPPGLDPGQALGLHTLRVTHQLFETLVTTPDDSTDVVPGLAESWTTSADGLVWTFKLRRGVRFHDGTALDAAAVKFSFDRGIDPLFFSKNTPLPNRSNYANPDVDQLLLQARQVADRTKRAELYRRAQQIIVDDAPWVFVDHELQVVATRSNVKGFKLHPSGFDLRVEHVTKD